MHERSISSYVFSTIYTTLPHNLNKDELIDLIGGAFQGEGSHCLACNDGDAFFASEGPRKYHAWSRENVCDVLTFLLNNLFIRFGAKLCGRWLGFLRALAVLAWLQIYSCLLREGLYDVSFWCSAG